MYYSQFGEDKILAEFFRDKLTGFCVEVGANDGVNGSNSLYFEEKGWDCILVEPNPALSEELRRNRKARVFECAASDRSGTGILHIATGAPLAHGVSTIAAAEEAEKAMRRFGFSSRPTTVSLATLDQILEKSNIRKPLDFISIDVEGHELQALHGFSIQRWKPAILIVEDNTIFCDRSVAEYLSTFGYVPFLRTGVNDWFTHRSNSQWASIARRVRYSWGRGRMRARYRLRKLKRLVQLRDVVFENDDPVS